MVRMIFSWIEYIISFLFFLFIWVFFEKYGLFILVVLWGLLPVYSYICMANAEKNCLITCRMKSRVIGRKEDNIFILDICNKGFFSQGRIRVFLETTDLLFNEKSEFDVEVPLHPGREEIEIPINSLHSGVRDVDVKGMEIPSMLGLFRRKKALSLKTEYVVMPDKLVIGEMKKVVSGVGNEELPDDDVKGNNSSQIREITEYKPGDRLQKIHWKASARKGELMVKEYEGTLSDQVTILVELIGDKDVLEDILSLSYAIASIKIDDIQKITFQWWNELAGEWKKLILTSEEELEQGIEELFYCSTYGDMDKAYEQVCAEGELAGSVIYISSINSQGIRSNEKLEFGILNERQLLAGASVISIKAA